VLLLLLPHPASTAAPMSAASAMIVRRRSAWLYVTLTFVLLLVLIRSTRPGWRGDDLIHPTSCMQCMPNVTKRNDCMSSLTRFLHTTVRSGIDSRSPVVNPTNKTQMTRALLSLREQILAGEFKPGERMSELRLVERFGVSRTPLRLALVELEHEGLLRGLPAGGYVVRAFTREDIRDAIELRGVLEGTAARFAAERGASRRDIRALHSINDSVAPLVHLADYESFERYVAFNELFHARLLKMADSPLLERDQREAQWAARDAEPVDQPRLGHPLAGPELAGQDLLAQAEQRSGHLGLIGLVDHRRSRVYSGPLRCMQKGRERTHAIDLCRLVRHVLHTSRALNKILASPHRGGSTESVRGGGQR
jgi:DNA-binding GntR family transcriptional regulator